jgi:NTE family protein
MHTQTLHSSVSPGGSAAPDSTAPLRTARRDVQGVQEGRSRRIGLVLGAGGAAGAAYHAGALLALQHDTGWDPRRADVIVGTSIGSIVASLLRAGLSTDDLAAWASGVEPLPARSAARNLIDHISADPLRIAPPRLGGMLGGLAQLPLRLRRLRRPSLAALSTLLPHGVIDAARALEQLGSLHVDWPTEPLWMTAVRTHDGQRVVFGREEHPPVGVAIGASCAIPLLLRPVKIGNHHYIDGATHSPTNADLLVDAGIEVAIVIAPMSGRSEDLRRRPDHALRAGFARRLRDEARRLVDAGVDVHLFEPDAAGLNALGINPIDRSRTVRVVPHAFLATGSQIQPSLAAVLRVAGQSAPARPHPRS